MQKQLQEEMSIKKLLLLGAGESGKSTLFKQLHDIYGTGFSDDEKMAYISIIHSNILDAIKKLIAMHGEYAGGLIVGDQEAMNMVATCNDGSNSEQGTQSMRPELGEAIRKVWAEPAIQATYENRSHFQLTDSAKYFMDKISAIATPEWKPDKDDMLRARIRTTGIVEKSFEIEGNKFEMYDVGGQRNERKKWIHCFDGVTAVMFVGVLSEYDMVLYEDDSTNRMEETLSLFSEICNYRYFSDTAMILFLNKRDLFEEKMKQGKSKLSQCPVFREKRWNIEYNVNDDGGDDDYTEEEIYAMYPEIDTYDGGCRAIQSKFIELNKNPTKQIYPHHTCATDRDNISFVFESVREIIIKGALDDAGLV